MEEEDIIVEKVPEVKIDLAKLPFDENEMLKIQSADGFEFYIDKRVASQSKTIKNMVSECYLEGQENSITFENFDGVILEKVFQYFYYKEAFKNNAAERPEFVIEPEIVLQVLDAAHYFET
eukprot:gene1110-10624_t